MRAVDLSALTLGVKITQGDDLPLIEHRSDLFDVIPSYRGARRQDPPAATLAVPRPAPDQDRFRLEYFQDRSRAWADRSAEVLPGLSCLLSQSRRAPRARADNRLRAPPFPGPRFTRTHRTRCSPNAVFLEHLQLPRLGLMRVLLTQAKRLQWLSARRYEALSGAASVPVESDGEE